MTILPIEPMLMYSTSTPPKGDSWLHQVKWDGIRCIMSLHASGVHMWSRNGVECSRSFPEFSRVATNPSLVLDGELVVLESGTASFESVMVRYRTTKEGAAKLRATQFPAHYVVFDILYRNDKDVMRRPLHERQEMLREFVPSDALVSVCDSFDDGEDLFQATGQLGWEGIVSKRRASFYTPAHRSRDWLKVKHYHFTVVSVVALRTDRLGIAIANPRGTRENYTVDLGASTALSELYRTARECGGSEQDGWVELAAPIDVEVKHVGYTRRGHMRSATVVKIIQKQ